MILVFLSNFLHSLIFCWPLILLILLIRTGQIHLTLRISRVTQKFSKKIIVLSSFMWSGSLIQYIANCLRPHCNCGRSSQRTGMGRYFYSGAECSQPDPGAAAGHYCGFHRTFIQGLERQGLWQDPADLSAFFHQPADFCLRYFRFDLDQLYGWCKEISHAVQLSAGQNVFLFLGLIRRDHDMGTGLNSQIIGTSTLWRFEFITGIILLAIYPAAQLYSCKKNGCCGAGHCHTDSAYYLQYHPLFFSAEEI